MNVCYGTRTSGKTLKILQEKDKEIERLTKQNKALNEMYELTKKEYIRLNNIIKELEKYLEKIIIDGGTRGSMTFWYRQIYDYLQELKGSDKE